MIEMEDFVYIFDTTLRDGEQIPGAKLNASQKLIIARQLSKLGVDVIEAGFPISSKGEEDAVRGIANEIRDVTICSLARAVDKDIDAAWRAIREAEKPRIHVFLGASKQHAEYKFRGATQQDLLHRAIESVQYARALCEEIEYSTEDASRSDPGYLAEVVRAVIEAGARIVNIPDTVGYAVPHEWSQLISRLVADSIQGTDAILSIHCHNDMGLAVANSLGAIKAGARQVECTINGLGERAGNAALEEIAVALKVRKEAYGCSSRIHLPELYRTSDLVRRTVGIPVQPNKAIVGDNAFRHSSGIHMDGILKHRSTYQILDPEEVGVQGHSFELTARSGRSAVRHALEHVGFILDEERFERIFQRFLEIADKKKSVSEFALEALASEEFASPEERPVSLENLQVTTGSNLVPTASVTLLFHGEKYNEAAVGDGPIDAVFEAIDRVVHVNPTLLDFSLKAVGGGKDAVGEVKITVEYHGEILSANGISTDIIDAGAKAYINVLNKILAMKKAPETTT